MSHVDLDARRLLCPMPVIRLQDQIKTLHTGDTVTVTCTDPGVMNDIPAWSRINGHSVINSEEEEYLYQLTIQVGATP
ncbi:MAG: sulfurtransferase TusA family protein [Gammaproteobacteria bacterium]|nr:sulfurtransferase TusA family protein [Gammaproteobacteria bacterium]